MEAEWNCFRYTTKRCGWDDKTIQNFTCVKTFTYSTSPRIIEKYEKDFTRKNIKKYFSKYGYIQISNKVIEKMMHFDLMKMKITIKHLQFVRNSTSSIQNF